MNSQELALQLLSRRPDVEHLISENKIVDDVMSGRTAIITRTPRKSDTGSPGITRNSPIAANADPAPVSGSQYPSGPESQYLPKHAIESFEEYQTRLNMTPFFPETPSILQTRQGALFRKPPDLMLPPELNLLTSKASSNGQSLFDIIVKISEMCQLGGFAGICLDREGVPEGVDPENVSVAEVQSRGIGRVIFAPYAAHQIRDWRIDERGLRWIKLVELHDGRTNWDEKPMHTYAVRIVDRNAINLWSVTTNKKGEFEVSGPEIIPHGARDATGNPVVPFRLFDPFPARDGIGRSNLRASAEADVAATRMLSDLLFFLHMMCPILTLTTNRPESEIKNIGLGASYLNILQGRRGETDAEKLAFTQLDPTAADRLSLMYDKLCGKAREQAHKSADIGVAGPVSQSGISRAWTFKTGEERVLFLLSICLEEGFQWLLDLASRMTHAGEHVCAIKFPASYDVSGIPEQVAVTAQTMPLLTQYGMKTAAVHVMKTFARHVMGNATETEIMQSDREGDKLLESQYVKHSQSRLLADEGMAPARTNDGV